MTNYPLDYSGYIPPAEEDDDVPELGGDSRAKARENHPAFGTKRNATPDLYIVSEPGLL